MAGNAKISRSPVPHLLGTNLIPSDLESIDIRKTFPDVQTNLSQRDAEIIRAETHLALLREERKNLQDYMNEHNALLSPARRLLPELWSEIFLKCLPVWPEHYEPSSYYDFYGKTFDVEQAPFLLTQVCSNWRTTALASPRLWAAIAFTIAYPEHSDSQWVLVQTCLTRSGICPLSLSINRGNHVTPSNDAAPHWSDYPAIRALISQSHRWEDVEIYLPPVSQARGSFAGIKGNLPQLRRLKIGLGLPQSQFERSKSEMSVLNLFEIAPQLQVLHLNSGVSVTSLEVPWAQLTHCSIHSTTSPTECLYMLRHCPNLISCMLTCTNTYPRCPSSASVVQHDQLRKLHLKNYGRRVPDENFGLGELLDNLKLPSLCDLNVQSVVGYHPQLFEFLARSPLPLRKLALKCDNLRDYELIHYLEQTPLLTDLRVEGPFVQQGPTLAISDKTLTHLTYAGIDTMLPRLENIGFEGGVYQTQRLADMVESRWRVDEVGPVSADRAAIVEDKPPVARLRSIRLDIPYIQAHIEPEIPIQLRQFKDEGLDVMVLQWTDSVNSRRLL